MGLIKLIALRKTVKTDPHYPLELSTKRAFSATKQEMTKSGYLSADAPFTSSDGNVERGRFLQNGRPSKSVRGTRVKVGAQSGYHTSRTGGDHSGCHARSIGQAEQ